MAEQQEQQALIYGVKTGDKFHYIGKTVKKTLNKSSCSRQYAHEELHKVFTNYNNIIVEEIKLVPESEWYDEKLQEVLKKYKDDNPLLNAKWMLEGKRGYWQDTGGYWQGKRRDAHTLKRLAESKYIKICEYDSNGNLKKIWNGAKEVAIQVFGDYQVIKGSGCTKLYDVLNATIIKNKFSHDSYWFRLSEMLEYFKGVPNKLNIDALKKAESQRRRESRKKATENRLTAKRYSVCQYDNGDLIKTYLNTEDCAFQLKLSKSTVQRICRGFYTSREYDLRYGEKILQNVKPKYPEYKIEERRTYYRYPVHQYNKNGRLIHTFDDVHDACERLGMKEDQVRLSCSGKRRQVEKRKDIPVLRYGEPVLTRRK